MEWTPLVKAQDRVKSWMNPTGFDVLKLRGLLQTSIMSSTIGEICAYRLLLQDIRGGELPSYVPDVLIVSMSALEVFATPFVSWVGFNNRRLLMISYTLIVMMTTTSLYFLPSPTIREESEFCDAANVNNDLSYSGMSARSVVRLIIIIISVLAFQVNRVASWTHGIGYSDEYAPERTSVHYGALILARVIILVVGNRLVAELLENLRPVQITLILAGYVFNFLKFFCVLPKHAPEVDGVQKTVLPMTGRGFPISMARVLSCPLVLKQAMAASLLAAAIYNFGFNQVQIIKIKFLIPASAMIGLSEMLLMTFIIFPIALAGVKFSVPVLQEYCKKKALKQIIIMTTFAFIFLVLLTTLPKCDKGDVSGLGGYYYDHPQCSSPCGCKPTWSEFNPVCVTDNMTTYLSPCHAGCTSSEIIKGIKVYTNCSCAGGGRALLGACSVTECNNQFLVHAMLFVVTLTFSLLAFQAQGVLILKTVDPRDRSVGTGVLMATIAMVAFVCGHLLLMAVRVATCSWHEGGECHLQSELFPQVVGFTSCFFALMSLIVSIASWVLIRVYDNNDEEDTHL